MTIRDHLSQRRVRRQLATIAAAGGVVASLAFPAFGSGPAPAAANGGALAARSSPAVAGAQLWVSRYGMAGSRDFADADAVSPADGTVFVTGWSGTLQSAAEFATIAYDPATGHQLWASRYAAPGHKNDADAFAITVSPEGRTVFVTGTAETSVATNEYITVAYNARTGVRLWVQRYSGGAKTSSEARALVVSHDGSAVYVTGYSGPSTGAPSYRYVTIAYNAVTGAQLWTSSYDTGLGENNQARAISISPDDQSIYVTGRSLGKGYDYATVAYDAATGARLWVNRYNNSKANGNDFANSIAIGPGGRIVFVTGGSAGKKSNTFATIAYSAATGARLWVSRYNRPINYLNVGPALAITPNGNTVVVTGSSSGKYATSYTTIAYNARTGAPRWTRRYPIGTGAIYDGEPSAVAISPDGTTTYVTGNVDIKASGAEDAYGTVAYSIATGAQLWVRFYKGPRNSLNQATALALSPSGNALYVTGLNSPTKYLNNAMATVAYRT